MYNGTQRLHAKVCGRVQLVMFRDFAMRHATRLGLKGFVKNMNDGTVEVVLEGSKEKLEELLRLLRKGPLLARVERVEETWSEGTDAFDTFTIRYV